MNLMLLNSHNILYYKLVFYTILMHSGKTKSLMVKILSILFLPLSINNLLILLYQLISILNSLIAASVIQSNNISKPFNKCVPNLRSPKVS